jgi:hypothetical protein
LPVFCYHVARHEARRDRETPMICRACYREIPPGSQYCPHCGARSGAVPPAVPQAAAVPPPLPLPAHDNPWEQRGGRGAVGAFAETLQRALFRPAAFFRGTDPDRGAGGALLYAVIVGTISLGVALLWQRALADRAPFEAGGRLSGLFESRRAIAGVSLFLPIGVALGNLVWAAVLHVSLAVLGGARRGFGATLKAVCYSSSATAFNVFPVCGAPIGAVWQVVVQIIGVRELHRTSTGRAFWAWLLPFVVAICLAGAVGIAAALGLARLWQELNGGRFEV